MIAQRLRSERDEFGLKRAGSLLPLPACGERVGARGILRTFGLAESPLTRIASAMRSDLSPQAGRGGRTFALNQLKAITLQSATATGAGDGGLHAGASVRSASAADAGGTVARSGGKTRARLSQLDTQPAQGPPARRARRAGVGHPGAGAGPDRRHRRSRQPGAGRGVCAVAGLAGKRRASGSRHGDSRQSRRLCSRHAASLCRGVGRLSPRRPGGRRRRHAFHCCAGAARWR